MKNQVMTKGDTFNVTLTAACVAGDPILMTDIVGIAVNAGAIGDIVAVKIEGVYTVAKATGAVTVGQKLYWDNAASNFTTTAGSLKLAGYAFSAQASGDTTVQLRLIS